MREKSDYGREKKPCNLNVVISSTVTVKSPWLLSQKENPEPFEESVSWDNIQQQMFQHKHVYQISANISSPKVITFKGISEAREC